MESLFAIFFFLLILLSGAALEGSIFSPSDPSEENYRTPLPKKSFWYVDKSWRIFFLLVFLGFILALLKGIFFDGMF